MPCIATIIIHVYPLFEDAFIEECELLRSDALENELEVMGEYATEETMRDQWGWSEFLARILLYLKKESYSYCNLGTVG